MKKWLVLCLVVMFLFTGLSFGQDCGKCPAAAACAKAKLQKEKALKESANLIVYVSKNEKKQNDKTYHKEECKLLKEKIEMKLGDAREKGYNPCTACFSPPKKSQETKKPEVKRN